MVMGFVYEQNGNKLLPLEGATATFLGTDITTTSDAQGMWMFEKPNSSKRFFIR